MDFKRLIPYRREVPDLSVEEGLAYEPLPREEAVVATPDNVPGNGRGIDGAANEALIAKRVTPETLARIGEVMSKFSAIEKKPGPGPARRQEEKKPYRQGAHAASIRGIVRDLGDSRIRNAMRERKRLASQDGRAA